MWQVLRSKSKLAVAILLAAGVQNAFGQSADTYINQSISGFNLPGVQLPQGHDEVRAADGTTCRSAVSGSGAYMDVGIIGNPESSNTDASYSAYTRVVIPLGKKPERINCARLYNLEVQRLEMELKLMQMGLTRGIAPVDETVSGVGDVSVPTQVAKSTKTSGNAWDDDGWSTDGLKEK